jgi:predicted amidophosphoribosyltransferase
VCGSCAQGLQLAPSLPTPLDLDACAAALDYADVRPLITSLKNGQRRELVGWLAGRMAPVAAAVLGSPDQAMVTWAPTSDDRRRRRGFDQAELLARAVARRLHLPCRELLDRLPGAPQHGHSAGERRANPTFRSRGRLPETVLVVDDVATTGATLSATGRALRSGGAARVSAVVAARAAPFRA